MKERSMSLLSVFSPPPGPDTVTVFEKNTNYVCEDYSRKEPMRQCVIQGVDYPQITLEKEGVKAARSLAKSGDEWDPFVSPIEDSSLWQRLFQTLSSKGLSGCLQEIQRDKEKVPAWLMSIGDGVVSMSTWFASLYGKVFPHLNLSREEMITAFSPPSHWLSSQIRAIAWHPHASKFALAWQDDVIKVHTLKSAVVPVLKHRQQRGIVCVAWRPLSASVLAVGCDTGVLVWTVDPTSPVTRLGSNVVQHLSYRGHSPVTTIAWSHDGQFLVSGSPLSSSLLLWDTTIETATPLYRAGGGISLTCWAPDESKLLVASPLSMFRIWETKTWTCEKWSNLSGRCKSACWSPDGSILVFAVAEEPALYYLKFNILLDDDGIESATSEAQVAVKCANLERHSWDLPTGTITVGGLVHTMAWDPTGERLAVIFEDDGQRAQPMVVMFKTRLKPTFEVLPSGFVQGPPDTIPQLIAFQQNFKHGAVLTVCWSDGTISFVPLLYTPLTEDDGQAYRGGPANGIPRALAMYSE
ncbi:aladin isoform X2 [Nematostella vectensis]|nr:aladin isoform X2 [Nematostella vectensis]